MPQLSSLTVPLVIAQLLDDSTDTKGFNYWVNLLAGSVEYPDVEPFQLSPIDSDSAGNLINAQIDEATIESLSLPLYPLVVVFTPNLEDDKFLTPSSFSGSQNIIVDFYTTFLVSELPLFTEEILDLIEDCMVEAFNRLDTHFIWENKPFTYNNQLRANRYPLRTGGENWRQKMRFTLTVNYGTVRER